MYTLARLVVLSLSLSVAGHATAQKHVQSTLDSRLVLAFRVNPAELQRWIGAPWQVAPVASGPSKDANLIVTFVDRLLDQDAEGKPVKVPTYRVVALAAPGSNPQTNETGPLLFRLYNSSPDAVPGFYKTAVHATVDREMTLSGSGAALERWSMRDGKGGAIDLQVQYQRGTPSRAKSEGRPRSGSDPKTWRIYRVEQSTDLLRSVHGGGDRVQKLALSVKVPELAKLFDGSEQLISVTSIPWYTRQTLLPDL
jgi:hypothetical protein